MKRLFDICFSFIGLILASPVLLPVVLAVWLQDFHSPFYIAFRVGKDGALFKMIKLRSMIIDADKTGVNSTASTDNRITEIGQFIRAFKLDELPQLLNVLRGDMSLVGPRPNVQQGVDVYTPEELHLLDVKPGITDIASIVFSDEGAILQHSQDPDTDYDLLIRPWKSQLGLIYIQHKNFLLDIKLIFWTLVAIFSREVALNGICKILTALNVNHDVIQVASRQSPLVPARHLA